jgi:hypothetical protein
MTIFKKVSTNYGIIPVLHPTTSQFNEEKKCQQEKRRPPKKYFPILKQHEYHAIPSDQHPLPKQKSLFTERLPIPFRKNDNGTARENNAETSEKKYSPEQPRLIRVDQKQSHEEGRGGSDSEDTHTPEKESECHRNTPSKYSLYRQKEA